MWKNELEGIIVGMFRPGTYVRFEKIQESFQTVGKRLVTAETKKVLKRMERKGFVKKGYGGMYYIVSALGTTPFYGGGVKLSKHRMRHLKSSDIGNKTGAKWIKILKAKSEEGLFNFKNYYVKRMIKNKLTEKKCRICGSPAYCMHHIKPLCKGGSNSKNNLVPVCEGCHRKIHPFMH